MRTNKLYLGTGLQSDMVAKHQYMYFQSTLGNPQIQRASCSYTHIFICAKVSTPIPRVGSMLITGHRTQGRRTQESSNLKSLLNTLMHSHSEFIYHYFCCDTTHGSAGQLWLCWIQQSLGPGYRLGLVLLGGFYSITQEKGTTPSLQGCPLLNSLGSAIIMLYNKQNNVPDFWDFVSTQLLLLYKLDFRILLHSFSVLNANWHTD